MVIDRLKTYIDFLGISERAFAQRCGIAQNTLSYYLSRQRKPSYEAICKIYSAFPDLSAEWLDRGHGEMLLSQSANIDRNVERINKLIDTITTLQETINAKNDTIISLTERIKQLENQHK